MRSILAIGVGVVLAVLPSLSRGGTSCQKCGCTCAPQRVCHVVCETKQTPQTKYSAVSEEFCVPGPSDRVARPADCDERGGLFGKSKTAWEWLPRCAEVRTRTKLVKTVTEKEEKAYRWVVEDLCPQCVAECQTTPK